MTEESIKRNNTSRLLFAQAIYGEFLGVNIHSAEAWVEQYQQDQLAHQQDPETEQDEQSDEVFQLRAETPPDARFLRKLLRGWLEEKNAVEKVLTTQLACKKRPYERLSHMIRAVLCAGAYEMVHSSVRPQVVLSEYTDIAGGFFDEPELGFINGTLQELANTLQQEQQA